VDDDTILFIETGDTKDKNENFKWHKEFNKEYEKLYLLINDPLKDPEAKIFNTKVEIKRSNTLLELKEKIGDMFGLSTSEIVVKRNV
jgi:hypothetical protein